MSINKVKPLNLFVPLDCTSPPGYVSKGNSDYLYKLYPEPAKWIEAKRTCEADGAFLAMIKDYQTKQEVGSELGCFLLIYLRKVL